MAEAWIGFQVLENVKKSF